MRWLVGLLLASCGTESLPTDAGTRFDGGSDVATADASTPDAAMPDASVSDAATSDAATADASSPDASVADAAVADASVSDGSTPDASVPLALSVPPLSTVAEDTALSFFVHTSGGVGAVRVFVENLPPGAEFDEVTGELRFTPDFIQGGHSWHLRFTADDGHSVVTANADLQALDTIHPPAPVVTRTETGSGFTRLFVSQTTDSYLDSPSRAGRSIEAVVIVPTSGVELPVRMQLHGFGGTVGTDGWSGEYRIYPFDPDSTYWWGYATQGTNPTQGPVPDYTARRVLNLLGWLLENNAGASRERVYLDGVSMGATGAMTLGLLHARHFCHVRAFFGQAIPRNHRPSRLAQLSTLWGTPAASLDDGHGVNVWDRQDLTRVVRDVPEARDQFLTLKHSKDDVTIHFGAVVLPSALTSTTFYRALQQHHVGHHAIWDEGGHDLADPVLGANWWTAGWDPVFDTTALLLRSRAFPAFSSASIDRNPGDGTGNGRVTWNPETGYAADVNVAGDTGWSGDVAGGLNRFLRWDGTHVIDTIARFEVPLKVLDGVGGVAPRAGYPTTGDRLDGTVPVYVDVTPRRVQAFRLKPFERVSWQFGAQSGIATADVTGAVTISRLALSTTFSTLTLTRVP